MEKVIIECLSSHVHHHQEGRDTVPRDTCHLNKLCVCQRVQNFDLSESGQQTRAATTKQLQDDFRSFNWWRRWLVLPILLVRVQHLPGLIVLVLDKDDFLILSTKNASVLLQPLLPPAAAQKAADD